MEGTAMSDPKITNADGLTCEEEDAIQFIAALFFSRCATVVWLVTASCLMAGVAIWKVAIVCAVVFYLYQSGFGTRWLERLACVVTVCAAVYFVNVVQFDKLVTQAMAWI
jgi:hypothetical protein